LPDLRSTFNSPFAEKRSFLLGRLAIRTPDLTEIGLASRLWGAMSSSLNRFSVERLVEVEKGEEKAHEMGAGLL